jgi:hypothetical protein
LDFAEFLGEKRQSEKIDKVNDEQITDFTESRHNEFGKSVSGYLKERFVELSFRVDKILVKGMLMLVMIKPVLPLSDIAMGQKIVREGKNEFGRSYL